MTIHIHDLEFNTIIGILEFERTQEQRVRVDCDIEHEEGFVDYAKAASLIRRDMIQNRYETVENALEGLRDALAQAFPVMHNLRLSIYKPDILEDCLVGATKKFNFS
jgi:dihydroneopterin aldolase